MDLHDMDRAERDMEYSQSCRRCRGIGCHACDGMGARRSAGGGMLSVYSAEARHELPHLFCVCGEFVGIPGVPHVCPRPDARLY